MERPLGLMCGAGVLPAQMAAEARRRGWRVVAFVFAGAPDMSRWADRTVPSRLTELGPVLAGLQREGVTAVLLAGRFAHRDIVAGPADAAVGEIVERAGGLVDTDLLSAVARTLGALGITLLDQREFLGADLAPAGCWSSRAPSEAEWRDVRAGFELAHILAAARIGQAVVVKRGAVVAVEALEGTSAAVRRGTALSGPGAVIVKVAARDHDYRFDTPTIGLETVEAAAAGSAAVVAVEAERVLVIDRDAMVARADAAGIALVSVADVAT